jgi:hypothetical protein
MFSETHTSQRDIADPRHHRADASRRCGGRAGKVELLTGIEGLGRDPIYLAYGADCTDHLARGASRPEARSGSA